MSFISRILGLGPDPREELRPLWHRIIEIAREEDWYAKHGASDTLEGRFDMITAVHSLMLLRMEKSPELVTPSVMLTELFVEDMDGQMREAGVGDVVVGKHIGKQMAVLGGRLGALRDALPNADNAKLTAAVERNLTLVEGADPANMASVLRALWDQLGDLTDEAIKVGDVPR
ncbi:ubiquinol-cytochrome C chaperone family protein [Altererythrobacter sp. ZODW24]|uniref:ubiquinol-cytochrome C chaperone family protein n=1 Tax=Altererythrobacter sp. ZODW24 TaxID=2185142 RepID=UPI000DF765C1|nr:ubiquinol-cytochrome C chaperone family protein [Altererythrobacter sp. ZODW24]